MQIREILKPNRVILDVPDGDKEHILRCLAAPVAEERSNISLEQLTAVLFEREKASSTAIADGIAIPHGKVELGDEVICVLGRSQNGVDFDSVDGQPTKLFFALVSPESQPTKHLRWLAHIAGLLKSMQFRNALLEAADVDAVFAAIVAEEEAHENQQ
jgi:PTS system nitrogen regulatory IIA component